MFGLGSKKVTSFTKITLILSGMRISEEFEIVCTGDESEISRFTRLYSRDGERRDLQEQSTCSTKETIDLLNMCGIMRWDGFRGRHPKGIKDGEMFRFSAEVNGGEIISAQGSARFPLHYRDLKTGFKNLLKMEDN